MAQAIAEREPTERLCALCAIRPATTDEHIPSKSLFDPPRPNDLVTVPSCSPCNNGYPLYRFASGAVHNDFGALQSRHVRRDAAGEPHLSFFRVPADLELSNLLDTAAGNLLRSCTWIHRGQPDFAAYSARLAELMRSGAAQPRRLSKLDHYVGRPRGRK